MCRVKRSLLSAPRIRRPSRARFLFTCAMLSSFIYTLTLLSRPENDSTLIQGFDSSGSAAHMHLLGADEYSTLSSIGSTGNSLIEKIFSNKNDNNQNNMKKSILKNDEYDIIQNILPQIRTHNDWQLVNSSIDRFYVYSAFYDDRNSNFIHIKLLAATRTRTHESVQCIYFYENSDELINIGRRHNRSTVMPKSINTSITDGSLRLIRENWNLHYSAYFILCPLDNESRLLPSHVSIIAKPITFQPLNNGIRDFSFFTSNEVRYKQSSNYNINRIEIKNLPSQLGDEKRAQIGICVKPIHYNYNKLSQIIEFIEFNRLLGVSHFLFYNHSISKKVNCALDIYENENLVTTLPWNLNMQTQKEIRTEGLFAALNDCLMRTMFKFRHVIFIDFDEYIIPEKYENLREMINNLSSENVLHQIGGYSFRNGFFYLGWNDFGESKLITQKKLRRLKHLHYHRQRSKMIVIPENVIEIGNHFVWQFIPGKRMVNVDPSAAYLHHYRICEFGGESCMGKASDIDNRTLHWSRELEYRVSLRLNEIEKIC